MKLVGIMVIGLIVLVLASCSEVTEGQFATLNMSTPLIAGQHIEVGVVEVENDDTTVTVSYQITEADWCLLETHIYLSTDAPKKAAPGKFAYGDDSLDCVTSYTEIVNLADLDTEIGENLYIATHAAVQGPSNETAWGEGPNQFRNGWGWYFSYEIEGGFGPVF